MRVDPRDCVTIQGRDLEVGDRLEFLGTVHIVDRIRPYGPTAIPHIVTPDTRVAESGGPAGSTESGRCWGMTIFADGEYRILPRVSAPTMTPQQVQQLNAQAWSQGLLRLPGDREP